MSSVTISCPKCNSGLKLPNRSLLGRKGKCPKCEHRFILEEPDEVQLELVEPVAPAAPVKSDQPLVGTSAKWVPDDVAGNEPVFSSAAAPPPFAPETPLSANSNAFPSAAPVGSEFDFSTNTAGQTDSAGSGTNEPESSAATAKGSIANRARRRKTKKGRTGPIAIGVGTALFAFSMLGLWWQSNSQKTAEAQQKYAAEQPKINDEWKQEKEELAVSDQDAKTLSPTSGGNIPMEFMPFTPHLICHLRPFEIWAADRSHKEFVATLGSLGIWLDATIRDITRFDPQDIEELTFIVNFGPRTSPPDVAAVVRLRSEQTASDLQLNRFPGTVRPDPGVQIFESDPYSYLLIDNKTFVVAPNSMSDLLAEAKSYSRQPSVELEGLLKESDRRRQVTVMFDIKNIDTHREYIFDEDVQTFADEFVLWFGKDIQTISWSMHLDKELFMETLLHENNESSPLRVQRYLKQRFLELPDRLQHAARFMKPANQGYRSMIGRFPAMMKAFVLGTSSSVGPAYVRLITLLPDKAGANLAAASLYTWNQSVVTDFTGPAPVVTSKGPILPNTVADRLKMPVIVDFRRMPLQEAFAYVADEIKTPIIINGDALKLAGMTQNMSQTYNLGEVSALKAIDAMLTNPDYKGTLVIVVDEAGKSITLTTRPVAEQAGLTIYDTSK